jgi:hypothetical protein
MTYRRVFNNDFQHPPSRGTQHDELEIGIARDCGAE